MQEAWIISACRTAIGKFGGMLANIPVYNLGCTVISEAIRRAKIEPIFIEEVIMGHALQAGTGQGAARVAAVKAGIPETSSAYTINNVCGSGLRAINTAMALIVAGENDIVIAGGMENMSQSPFLLPNMRFGNKLGDSIAQDAIIQDGLTDSFENYHMGITAEAIASQYGISRIQQDEYAVLSQNRAEKAISNNVFLSEIVPVSISDRNGISKFLLDEHCRKKVTVESISGLKPSFCENGTVTAANSSGINDGAASLVIASTDAVRHYGLKPIAKLIASVSVGVDHRIMGIGSAVSIKKNLQKVNIKISDIDLFEVNEAFSAQVLATMKELNINIEKLNINGGAIALGHPIGASGARILVTLLNNLLHIGGRFGVASICVGGGMGISTIVEIVSP